MALPWAVTVHFLLLIPHVESLPEAGNFTGLQCVNNITSSNPTLDECEHICGVGYQPYSGADSVGSIINWVIPLFALVGNMHFSHFEVYGRRFRPGNKLIAKTLAALWSFLINYGFVIVHVLADPIDTICSLLDTLDYP